MKIIRASTCRTTPWKNGGGSTTEIAVEPPDASLEDFDWRISMALVASDGPFSAFDDIDRTLAVVRGNGLVLAIAGNAPVTLDRESDPIQFAGDVATSARLLDGAITDLNVMTRRQRFVHGLQRIRKPTPCDFDGNDVAVVVCCSGRATLTAHHEVAMLDRGDAAVLARADHASFRVAPAAHGDCYLVLLRERRSQPG